MLYAFHINNVMKQLCVVVEGQSALFCHQKAAQGLYFVEGKILCVLCHPALYKILMLIQLHRHTL